MNEENGIQAEACLSESGQVVTLREDGASCLAGAVPRRGWSNDLRGSTRVFNLVRYLKERGDFDATVDELEFEPGEVLARVDIFEVLEPREYEMLMAELHKMAEQYEFAEMARLGFDDVDPVLAQVKDRGWMTVRDLERERKRLLAELRRKRSGATSAQPRVARLVEPLVVGS